ncbi:MAG: phosphatidate cytidylyltransferase [Clostridia bacterium]|nr:phosphatidate cytidylyltransferase [Clostridia bacterium]
MTELLHGAGLIVIYFLVCASTALVAHALLPIPSEVFRKILHLILLGSLAVWVLGFSRWWLSALSAVVFALAVYPLLSLAEHLRGYSALLTERKSGEIKHSLLVVFTMYALVAAVCWGWLGDKLLTLASIYAWGFGDAAAALVGKRFGKHHFKTAAISRKSWEGTLAMFAVSFVTVAALLHLRGNLSLAGIFLSAAGTAAVSAAVELYTPNGMDTITCPLAAMTTLLPLVAWFGGAL